jgi:hypothetical protein
LDGFKDPALLLVQMTGEDGDIATFAKLKPEGVTLTGSKQSLLCLTDDPGERQAAIDAGTILVDSLSQSIDECWTFSRLSLLKDASDALKGCEKLQNDLTLQFASFGFETERRGESGHSVP